MTECLLPSGNNNAMMIKIINFFISKGLTPNQALGICANVFAESGYNPRADNPNDKDSHGRPGHSHGLFQWRDGTDGSNVAKNSNSIYGHRYTDMYRYCTKNNLDYNSADAQLSFCWHENGANFQKYFSENRGITAEQACKWWKEKWEVGCCLDKRLNELKKIKQVYTSSVKSSDCGVTLGDGEDSSTGGCDPSSMAYTESGDYGGTSTQQSYYSADHPYEPLGKDVSNTKPVLFGGSWAFKMSPYMTNNDNYFAYTQWGQSPLTEVGYQGQKNYGDMFMGGVNDRKNGSISLSTIRMINNYISRKGNNPTYFIVSVDMWTSWHKWKKKNYSNASERINELAVDLREFFSKIDCMKVIVPLLVESWDTYNSISGSTYDFHIVNGAIKKAASSYANISWLEVKNIDKGSSRPSNGILPEDAWRSYSNAIKSYCQKF